MSKQIIHAEQIEALSPDIGAHYLNEEAVHSTRNLGELVGLSGLGVRIIDVEPGKPTTECHFHHHEDECVFVLEGELELRLGDEIFLVKTGDFIGHPAGGPAHEMRNVGSGTARYLVFGQRLEKDVIDYPSIKKRLLVDGQSLDLVDLD